MAMNRVFALVDCNNFYASCERAFRPDLAARPVVVLSNNDGCIVARSAEVKALAVPMGVPYFKVRALLEHHNVKVFSSNYALYGDLSDRVMAVLAAFSPDVEVYSIDEAFLGLDGFAHWDVAAHARRLGQTVHRWTGIPVSVGIGPTKTLAKVAAERAKKDPALSGVCVLANETATRKALAATPVGDVWGIGRRWGPRLVARGCESALDFTNLDAHWVRGEMGVVGARTQTELLGTSTLSVKTQPTNRKSCIASRSFSQPVTSLEDLKEAVATFGARAAERLRRDAMGAGQVCVYITTDRFNDSAPQYRGSAQVALEEPSNNTVAITRAALRALEAAFRPGFAYKKAGVMALELAPANACQMNLFAARPEAVEKAGRLQDALDRINGHVDGHISGRDRDLVHVGARSAGSNWHTRQHRRSPRYTTHWAELPIVYAG